MGITSITLADKRHASAETNHEPVTLDRKQAFLASGEAWPDEPPPDCIETHASLVFLTRDRAWKLKKPVKLLHLDLRTLQARAHYCGEELRLNRELAGDIYRSVTPLVQLPDGRLALGQAECECLPGSDSDADFGTGTGAGALNAQTVDWLIEMTRLPADEMLDRRIRFGPSPQPCEIEAVCDVLLKFYAGRPRLPDAGRECYEHLLRESRINAEHLLEMRHTLGTTVRQDILQFGCTALETCRSEIHERGMKGYVIEGHGDLRAEHVCLTTPPVVFDRLEFDHGIRLIDPYDEFNALCLDCQSMGADWVRDILLVRLAASGMAPPSNALMMAYGVNRCLTRARLAIDHLRDRQVRMPEKWPAQARRQLETAIRLIESPTC